MTTYTCTATGCPNKGVTYTWETTETEPAQCGGCGEPIEATND